MDKIAVLVLAHKNPSQLARLAKSLDDKRFDMFVHIDLKSNIQPFKEAITSGGGQNVTFVTKRFKTYFFDYSLVDATCSCLSHAHSVGNYKYYVLLSGQDYPIKPLDYIYDFLMHNYPICWIDSLPVENAGAYGGVWANHVGWKHVSQGAKRHLQDVFGHFYFAKYGKLLRGGVRVLDEILTVMNGSPRSRLKKTEFVYSCGSHFWMVPDVCATVILDHYQNSLLLTDVFAHSGACEETYFQTSLSSFAALQLPDATRQFGSPLAEMDNPALRLIKWYENGVHTNGHPAIWKQDDFNVIKSAKALFARKFDESIDGGIMDKIDAEILSVYESQ